MPNIHYPQKGATRINTYTYTKPRAEAIAGRKRADRVVAKAKSGELSARSVMAMMPSKLTRHGCWGHQRDLPFKLVSATPHFSARLLGRAQGEGTMQYNRARSELSFTQEYSEGTVNVAIDLGANVRAMTITADLNRGGRPFVIAADWSTLGESPAFPKTR